MKQGIHPDYGKATVRCSCGNTFETRLTVDGKELRVELCSQCHPFYTGKQKLVDTGGRVERFQRRYAKQQAARDGTAKAPTPTTTTTGTESGVGSTDPTTDAS